MRVIVVGAGAFGGWTALQLVRRGARVTLIDAWGPGHTRASSGGETRIIRAGYGNRAIYTQLTIRARELWRAHDRTFGQRLLVPAGCLWLCDANDTFGRATAETLRREGVEIDEITRKDAKRRYPQINFSGIDSVFFEPDAGYLFARRACAHVAQCVVDEGGAYLEAKVATPIKIRRASLDRISVEPGGALEADAFVFACGPWLPDVFPNELGQLIRPTRQEVYYFGTPGGDERFESPAMPVWIELGSRLMYGIPGNAKRGFKVADDKSGPPIDPTTGDRTPSRAGARATRRFLAHRFPALANAPFVGAEVCQYEASPDAHFIIDRHPRADNVWIAGGGSGHGFKMGPVIGERIASMLLDDEPPDPTFALARFTSKARTPISDDKWS